MASPNATFDLPEALDTAAASALADGLRTLRGSTLVIDAAGVRRTGALCVQLLLSAAKTWRADGVALTLRAPSPDFVEALRLMGLTPEKLSAGDDRA